MKSMIKRFVAASALSAAATVAGADLDAPGVDVGIVQNAAGDVV